jgi:hypothetical protein
MDNRQANRVGYSKSKYKEIYLPVFFVRFDFRNINF